MKVDLNALVKYARILEEDDRPNADPDLQAMVGDPEDKAVSAFTQFQPNPGTNQIPNPLSPLEGDDIFFSYLIPGSQFQSHDGSIWLIQNYVSPDEIEIYNIWYPNSSRGIVGLNDIRRSIARWTSPVTLTVPDAPAGVDYGSLNVKVVADNSKKNRSK